MRKFGRWAARVIGTALALVLAIVMLPYASRLAQYILPDLGDRAITASVTLSQKMQQTARLETLLVEEEGIVSSSTDALLIGTVQQVTVQYAYQASIGIDLQKVELVPRGSRLTLILPEMEVLTDSITPLNIERNDFWYPLTDKQLQNLMEEEKLRCRSKYLDEYAQTDSAWEQMTQAMEASIGQWLGHANGGIEIRYEKAAKKH